MRYFGFCSNAFPAWDLDSLTQDFFPQFKQLHHQVNSPVLALDLQLGAGIVEKLPQRGGFLAQKLKEFDLEVGSLNLFPLCNFQADVVKTNVYSPNWLDEERHRLTLMGAKWVAEVLKPQKKFSISTLAGCYHREGKTPAEMFPQLAKAYSHFAEQLATLKKESGCHIILCLEPEPFTSLQKIQDVLDLWQHFDSPASKTHLGINLDCCHFSVMGERPLDAWRYFKKNNIPVPKIHASTALKLKGPLNQEQINFLKEMNEPRFLHQTSLVKNNTISHHHDLDEVFPLIEETDELYCHFHMPLFLKEENGLFGTTEKHTLEILKEARKENSIEIYAETYTWSILGKNFASDPYDGIYKELLYLKKIL